MNVTKFVSIVTLLVVAAAATGCASTQVAEDKNCAGWSTTTGKCNEWVIGGPLYDDKSGLTRMEQRARISKALAPQREAAAALRAEREAELADVKHLSVK